MDQLILCQYAADRPTDKRIHSTINTKLNAIKQNTNAASGRIKPTRQCWQIDRLIVCQRECLNGDAVKFTIFKSDTLNGARLLSDVIVC